MNPGDHRKAYGEPRASVMESLLTTVYPGAQVQWDPNLMVRMPGGGSQFVQVPVSLRGSASGGLEGVATVEWERAKETYIHDSQHFRRADRAHFSTQLIVFRADARGHITKHREFDLDPSDELTEIKTFSVEQWQETDWPTLHVQYNSHFIASDTFTIIEWQGSRWPNSPGKMAGLIPSLPSWRLVPRNRYSCGPSRRYQLLA